LLPRARKRLRVRDNHPQNDHGLMQKPGPVIFQRLACIVALSTQNLCAYFIAEPHAIRGTTVVAATGLWPIFFP